MSKIVNPIFFIGVPRSGTTILFEALARHNQLGWPSDYTANYPTMPILGLILYLTNNKFINLSGLKKQYNKVSLINKILPVPAEAYKFWNYYTELDFGVNYFIDVSATEQCKIRVSNAVSSILRWEGKQRFSAKLTGPSRIQFIKSIFPDAKFVHVIRDGRAVVHSLLNVHFWKTGSGYEKPWWNGGLSEQDLEIWQSTNKEPAVLAAVQWKKIIEIARSEKSILENGSYIEIKYEDFIEKPNELLEILFSWCNLSSSNRSHHYVDNQSMRNMNDKYKKGMSEATIDLITKAMDPLLSDLGYE